MLAPPKRLKRSRISFEKKYQPAFTYKALNKLVQGSAADIIKIAMINIQEQLAKKQYNSKMLLQVHDELVFDVYKSELNDIISLVKNEMENAFSLKVPLLVDINYGQNWLEAH